MSGVTGELAPLDLSGTKRIALSRLVRVELRKMADTRAGMWLLIGICVLTAGVMTIFLFNADEADRTFKNFMIAAAFPQQFVLPVLGILLVTSEWSQRTALVSFTLEPVRSRLVVAKVVAALLFGLAAVGVAMAIAAVATALGGNDVAWDDFGAGDIGKFVVLQASSILEGFAFGMLILNSAGAIATFFILPTAFQIVTSLWTALHDVAPWIDINSASSPLLGEGAMSGTEWAHFGVASLVWVVAPFLVGLVRVLRREVK